MDFPAHIFLMPVPLCLSSVQPASKVLHFAFKPFPNTQSHHPLIMYMASSTSGVSHVRSCMCILSVLPYQSSSCRHIRNRLELLEVPSVELTHRDFQTSFIDNINCWICFYLKISSHEACLKIQNSIGLGENDQILYCACLQLRITQHFSFNPS